MAATESGPRAQPKRRAYRCFLLRCRLEEGASPGASQGPGSGPASGSESVWRFTVQQPGRGAAARPFARLNDVMAYIGAELASCSSLERSQPKAEFRNSAQQTSESEYNA